MCLKKYILILLVLLSVLSLYGQSAKESAINKLTNYQIQLQQVKLLQQESNNQILDLSKQIQDYQLQIDNYKKELIDSKNKSEIEIQNIKDNLTKVEIDLKQSKQDLLKSQDDLKVLQTLYNQLSMDLSKLKTSLALSNSIKYILITVVVIETTYIIVKN